MSVLGTHYLHFLYSSYIRVKYDEFKHEGNMKGRNRNQTVPSNTTQVSHTLKCDGQ